MRCRHPIALAAVLAVAAAAGVSAQNRARVPRVSLEPCRWQDVPEGARCGVVAVPEDRTATGGRTVPLRVVVLPALRRRHQPEPLVVFSGGPGQSVTRNAAAWGASRAGVWAQRDLVLIDLRGTGASQPLDCPWGGGDDDPQGWFGDILPLGQVRACRALLAPRADLRRYTAEQMADDVDDVRAALGYERLNLQGSSWGTRLALIYLERHPRHVRALVLNSTLPPWMTTPLFHARDFDAELRSIFAECARQPRCAGAYPDPARDLAAVLARLERGPVRITIRHPRDSRETAVTLERGAFAERLRSMAYGTAGAVLLPYILHQAARGDFGPYAEQVLEARGGSGLALGVFLSSTCAEDVPHIDTTRIRALTAGTTLGDYRIRQQQAACAEWPRGTVSPDFARLRPSRVPTLFLNGEWDPVTPQRWAAETARVLPNSRRVLIPYGPHVVGSQCVALMVADFLRTADPAAVDTSCVRRLARPVFFVAGDADSGVRNPDGR
jgi:pimeloyl-ACP methyl ester carboxylesterase